MDWIKKIFSIDLRTIALFRVCLATMILADLFLRSFSMKAFYTDIGVLPRATWLQVTNKWHFSLHAASGDLFWQILLFTIAAVFALGLLVGYRSKLMAFLSFLLLASLINRNQLITQAGDQLLVVMSFWSLFLPLGARYSVDAALNPAYQKEPNRQLSQANEAQPYFSIATIAVIFQVLYLYFFTALLKTGAAWRVRFDAAFYAVSLDHFATPIGIWIRQFPTLLKIGTFYVLAVEFVAPAMVLLPFRWPWLRIIGLLLLASLHVAFLLMLHIGLFPLIDFMSLTLLIPSAVWVWLAARRKPARLDKIVMYYDQDCGFCLKMCLILRELLLSKHVKIYQAQQYPHIFAIMDRENSWVIEDADGKHYIHWHAMRHLFAQRWVFKPLSWLMGFPPFMALGNTIYSWVANNRGTMSNVTASALPWRSIKSTPGIIGQCIALYFFVGVTIYNITGLPNQIKHRPDVINRTVNAVRLDQKWSMFAPYPLTVSYYPQIQGTLRDKNTVNLYPLTDTNPGWDAPVYKYPLYESYRWRKYLGKIRAGKDKKILKAYGDYHCRNWNTRSRPGMQQLGIFDINFVTLPTNRVNKPKSQSRKLAWKHWCFAEFSPNR